MFKKVKDLTFSMVLIFVIAVGIYWLMVELQKDYLDHYLSILGDKLIELVPESSEKRTLKPFLDDFKKQVENQEVTPEQVEKVAAGILNMSNLKDSITVTEARAVLELAEVVPEPDLSGKQPRVMVIPEPKRVKDAEVRWRELGERLESIYKLDQQIKTIPDSVKLNFRFDQNLNIIVDDHAKAFLEQEDYKQMAREIRRLEKEKALIWKKNVAEEMANIRIHLKVLREKDRQNAVNALEKIAIFYPEYNIDSLSNVMMEINIDSVNILVEEELEREHLKNKIH